MPENDGIQPADPDHRWDEFLKVTMVELMTPEIIEMNIALKVEVPFSVGQHILMEARENVELAQDDALDYIKGLRTTRDFLKEELDGIVNALRNEGYDVKLDIRASDSPRIGSRYRRKPAYGRVHEVQAP